MSVVYDGGEEYIWIRSWGIVVKVWKRMWRGGRVLV